MTSLVSNNVSRDSVFSHDNQRFRATDENVENSSNQKYRFTAANLVWVDFGEKLVLAEESLLLLLMFSK